MRFFTFLTAAATAASGVFAQTATNTTDDSTAKVLAAARQLGYPDCAIKCMASLVPKSTCTLTDTKCLCTNVELNAHIGECVLGGCNKYEALAAKNASMTRCGAPVRDESTKPLAIGLGFGGFALVVFILRMCSILPGAGRIPGWDDWILILAALLAVPPTYFVVPLAANGLGRDIWTLKPENIETVIKFYYLGEIFYFLAITTTKVSIVLCIMRVFPDKSFQKQCWAVMALVLVYGLAFLLATMFQCWPISYMWMQLSPHWEGKCNDIHMQGWLSAGFNILIDLVVLALPLKNLWGLQLQMKKKIMLLFLFSLGLFVTVISVIRLKSLITFANSENLTWDHSEAAWWSTVEIHLGIVCASLPAVRSLFVHLGVKALGTRKGTSRGTGSSSYGRSRSGSKGLDKMDSKGSVGLSSLTGGGTTVTVLTSPKKGDERSFSPLVNDSNEDFGKVKA